MKKRTILLLLALVVLVSCAQRREAGVVPEDVERPAAIEGEQILKRMAYTVSYNKETRCPNWVAWKLTAEHADGGVKRITGYDFFPLLPDDVEERIERRASIKDW